MIFVFIKDLNKFVGMKENFNFKKTVAEFFAGIGLMRSGLEEVGWKIIFANDIDPMKQKI